MCGNRMEKENCVKWEKKSNILNIFGYPILSEFLYGFKCIQLTKKKVNKSSPFSLPELILSQFLCPFFQFVHNRILPGKHFFLSHFIY